MGMRVLFTCTTYSYSQETVIWYSLSILYILILFSQVDLLRNISGLQKEGITISVYNINTQFSQVDLLCEYFRFVLSVEVVLSREMQLCVPNVCRTNCGIPAALLAASARNCLLSSSTLALREKSTVVGTTPRF